MIKLKNQGEVLLELATTGTQSTASGNAAKTSSVIVPFAGRLKAVFARLGVAGVTGTQTTDILLNGASLVSTGTLLSYASTSVVPTYATANLNNNPPIFAKGDVLQMTTTAVASGTTAIDQCIYLVIERQRSGSWNDAVQTDTIGVDSDQI